MAQSLCAETTWSTSCYHGDPSSDATLFDRHLYQRQTCAGTLLIEFCVLQGLFDIISDSQVLICTRKEHERGGSIKLRLTSLASRGCWRKGEAHCDNILHETPKVWWNSRENEHLDILIDHVRSSIQPLPNCKKFIIFSRFNEKFSPPKQLAPEIVGRKQATKALKMATFRSILRGHVVWHWS